MSSRRTSKGAAVVLSTITLKGGAAVYESRGDTCNIPAVRLLRRRCSRVSGSVTSFAKGKSDKAYANWGRYYTMDQKSSGAQPRAEPDFSDADDFRSVRDTSFRAARSPPTTGKLIDPALEPIYNDEIVLGYAHAVQPAAYSVDVFFMSRTMHNFIEDVPSRLNGTAPDSGRSSPTTCRARRLRRASPLMRATLHAGA